MILSFAVFAFSFPFKKSIIKEVSKYSSEFRLTSKAFRESLEVCDQKEPGKMIKLEFPGDFVYAFFQPLDLKFAGAVGGFVPMMILKAPGVSISMIEIGNRRYASERYLSVTARMTFDYLSRGDKKVKVTRPEVFENLELLLNFIPTACTMDDFKKENLELRLKILGRNR